jgi:hypothetical protein
MAKLARVWLRKDKGDWKNRPMVPAEKAQTLDFENRQTPTTPYFVPTPERLRRMLSVS